MSRKRAAARATSVPLPDVRGDGGGGGGAFERESGRRAQPAAAHTGAPPAATQAAAGRTSFSSGSAVGRAAPAAEGKAAGAGTSLQPSRAPHPAGSHHHRSGVLPSPRGFFVFHGVWASLAALWILAARAGQVPDRRLADPAFAATAVAIGYHFTVHLLCNYRRWTELRRMWCYAAVLGVAQVWTQRMQSELDKPFVIPLPAVPDNPLTAPIVGIFPLRLVLWNIVPPFVSIYVGFLSHRISRSQCLGYVGAAVAAGLLVLGALNLSAQVLGGALGDFRLVRYLPLPEPTFVSDVDLAALVAFPKPPYFGRIPAYMVLPSLGYGALAFEGYKVAKGVHKSAFGTLAVSLAVAMAHLGLTLSSYAALERSGAEAQQARA